MRINIIWPHYHSTHAAINYIKESQRIVEEVKHSMNSNMGSYRMTN